MIDDATFVAQLVDFLNNEDKRSTAPSVKSPDGPTCAVCKRVMRKRIDGPCRVIMELEPDVFKRCGHYRGQMGSDGKPFVPIDVHTWHGGFDHLRDERDDRICACGHPYHETGCSLCEEDTLNWQNSSHPYQPGMIELDHEARE